MATAARSPDPTEARNPPPPFLFPDACPHGTETSQALVLLPDVSNTLSLSEILTVAVKAH